MVSGECAIFLTTVLGGVPWTDSETEVCVQEAYWGCLWNQHRIKRCRGWAGGGVGLLCSATETSTLKVSWPLRIVPNWGKGVGPFCPPTDWSLDVGCPWVGDWVNPEGGSSLPQRATPSAGDSCEPSAANAPSSWGKEYLHLEWGVCVENHSIHPDITIML